MAEAAATLALVAAGQAEAPSGTVRLTASRIVSHHILPPILARLRREEPGIQIELVPSDSTENLLYREADIALRMYRPTQLDMVTRHIADLPTAIYAAKSYLDRAGRPRSTEELMQMEFLGFDRSDIILRLMAAMGFPRKREDFPIRCDDQIVYWNLVRAGCGIGATQCLIGDADPLVERCADFVPMPALPVWLTTPEALRHTPRIRRVMDHLAAGFAGLGQAP
jgi:DNA-binding transcriptional LysR family regulator